MIHPTALLAFAAQLREQARAALQAPGRQDPTALRALMQALDITADRLAAGPPRRPAPGISPVRHLAGHVTPARCGEPEEVVGAAGWLASDASGYVTGASIDTAIDGGLSVAVCEDWRALRLRGAG